MERLKGALPSGSLQQPCLELWRSAGYRIDVKERSLFPTIDDPELELILLRPQEIPQYVAEGKIDFGIAGFDCVVECDCEQEVIEMGEFVFSKKSKKPTVWVLAVAEDSPFQEVNDLKGKLIVTEFVRMTRKFLFAKYFTQDEVDVRFSWGATEVKPGRFCDAILEATETGESLRRNGLRIIARVLESTPRFIADPAAYADPLKREKMEDIVLMLKGALDAEGKVFLAMNVELENLDRVVEILPALYSPTMSPLMKRGWFALSTVIEETVVRVIIPKLKRAGATCIVESPVSKLIM